MNKIFLSLLLISSQAFGAKNTDIKSVYTSIEAADCKTIEVATESDPIDFYTGECAGADGYSVLVTGGDLRYSIVLKVDGKQVELTNIGAFHSPGSNKIEWRGPVKNGKVQPSALIFRLNIDDSFDQNDLPVGTDSLFVVRLMGTKSCVIGVVKQQPEMNSKARTLADDLTLPCLPSSR
jgi:hypothetical protein